MHGISAVLIDPSQVPYVLYSVLFLWFQRDGTAAQEVCESELKSDEEGRSLLSRFPGCRICCTVVAGWFDGGVWWWWWCRLLLLSPCDEELWGSSCMRVWIFEAALWVCVLLGKGRLPIKMSSFILINNSIVCWCLLGISKFLPYWACFPEPV